MSFLALKGFGIGFEISDGTYVNRIVQNECDCSRSPIVFFIFRYLILSVFKSVKLFYKLWDLTLHSFGVHLQWLQHFFLRQSFQK